MATDINAVTRQVYLLELDSANTTLQITIVYDRWKNALNQFADINLAQTQAQATSDLTNLNAFISATIADLATVQVALTAAGADTTIDQSIIVDLATRAAAVQTMIDKNQAQIALMTKLSAIFATANQ